MDTIDGFWAQVVAVWSTGIFGVGLGEVLLAVVVFFVFLFARRLFSRFIIRTVKTITKRTASRLDDQILEAVEEPLRFVFVVIGIYTAGQVAPFPEVVNQFLDQVVRSLIAFTIFWTLYRCVEPLSYLLDKLTGLFGTDGLRDSLRGFFAKLGKFVIACLGVVAVLEEWDFNVAAVLGGLGLVGMAVAFGAQNLISNLFSGIAIFLDNMFEKGDWIRTPDVEGTVEEIGFRTTQIRRFDKALVTIPNAMLGSAAVVNFSRMINRRIYWVIGLQYSSTEGQLKAVVRAIIDYVRGSDDFETDPSKATTLINVDSFNDSSIDIMFYCFTKTTDWGKWMIIKEELAYRIKAIVEDNGAAFAFPSS
ncbi:MAG: mechanosensitive ion channel family protein, partial [Alphaproteobacteria bacterium]